MFAAGRRWWVGERGRLGPWRVIRATNDSASAHRAVRLRASLIPEAARPREGCACTGCGAAHPGPSIPAVPWLAPAGALAKPQARQGMERQPPLSPLRPSAGTGLLVLGGRRCPGCGRKHEMSCLCSEAGDGDSRKAGGLRRDEADFDVGARCAGAHPFPLWRVLPCALMSEGQLEQARASRARGLSHMPVAPVLSCGLAAGRRWCCGLGSAAQNSKAGWKQRSKL